MQTELNGRPQAMIAMSGGVDSSAAALLLQKQGYECAGATLSLCENDVDGARKIAEGLHMPFYVFDEHERFSREVMDRFVSEYCAGRTPNPCIDCNRCLKFGALLDRALVLGYDYIATGHYARVDRDPDTGLYRLLRKRLHTRYVTAALATTVFLISYAVLSGNGVSTQRAVGMCLIYLFADVTGYAYDMLNALGIVVLVLLWKNPSTTIPSAFNMS